MLNDIAAYNAEMKGIEERSEAKEPAETAHLVLAIDLDAYDSKERWLTPKSLMVNDIAALQMKATTVLKYCKKSIWRQKNA